MYNRENIMKSINALEKSIAYHKTRIKEAKKIVGMMHDYFDKYQLSNSTSDWESEIAVRENDMKNDIEQLKKLQKMLKLLDELDKLNN